MIPTKGKQYTTNQLCIIHALNGNNGQITFPYTRNFLKTAQTLKAKGIITFTYNTKGIRINERTQNMFKTQAVHLESSDAQQLFENYDEQVCGQCGQIVQVDTEQTESEIQCPNCGMSIQL